MNIVKKILGTIFATLFVLTAVPALIFFNFDRRSFTAETYQAAFANADFYNKLPVVMAQVMTSSNTDLNGNLPIVMRGMSQNAWEAFFRTLLPQETLKSMSDDLLNSAFAYFNMQSDSVQLSLTPIKTSMASDTGVQSVFTLLNTQPDCTMSQIAQMTLDMLSQGQVQFCKPPEKLYPLLTPIVQGQMKVTASALPDQLILVNGAISPENDPRVKLGYARISMRLSPLLPLIFLFLMTIFTVSSFKNWLIWWGIPLSITGFLAILVSLSGAPIFGVVLRRILVSRLPDFLPAVLLDYAGELASAMLKALLSPVLWQGLTITVIGLVMAVGSYFISRREKRTSQTTKSGT